MRHKVTIREGVVDREATGRAGAAGRDEAGMMRPFARVPFTRMPFARVPLTRMPFARVPLTRMPLVRARFARMPFVRVTGEQVARWLALALLGSTIGCATVGHEFSPGYVPQITIGQTTKSDMRLMFGEPYRRGIDDGDSTWTYVHYKFRLFGEHMKTRDLLIRWNKDDRVRSYSYNSNMD